MSERTPSEIERDIATTRAEMSQTIDAIQERLSPGQLVDQALHYFKGGNGRALTDGAAEFGQNLGRTIRDNPVPLALVVTGLAWLMLARGRRRTRGRVSRDYDQYVDYNEYDELEDLDELEELEELEEAERLERERGWSRHYGAAAEEPATPYEDRPGAGTERPAAAGVGPSTQAGGVPRAGLGGSVGAASVSEQAEEQGRGPGRVEQATGRARQAAEDARQRTSEAAHDARDWAREGAGAARERLHRAGESARHGIDRAGRGARRRAREATGRARYEAGRARRGFSHMLEERPLMVGAIALAIGAALGALLPATRREDEWLGSTRDDLGHRVARAGREEFAKAERVARRAVDTARTEAERENLTGEGLREDLRGVEQAAGERVRETLHEAKQAGEEKLHQTQDKVRRVAEATTEAARDEARRQDLGSGRPSGG